MYDARLKSLCGTHAVDDCPGARDLVAEILQRHADYAGAEMEDDNLSHGSTTARPWVGGIAAEVQRCCTKGGALA